MENRIHDTFDIIKADSTLKESTKQFLSKRNQENLHPHRHPVVKYTVSAVCALLIAAIAGLGYSWMKRPVSYVSIDVNPSIELALNRFDRVVYAESYNAEGREILDSLSLKWKKYKDAIDLVIGCEEMQAYLVDQSELVLTVAAAPGHEAELITGVGECTGHMGRGCRNTQADITVADQAHENGLSCGKYNAYLQLIQYDGSITLDDCREMSMDQIQEKLRECKDAGADGSDEDSGNNRDGSPSCPRRHRHHRREH